MRLIEASAVPPSLRMHASTQPASVAISQSVELRRPGGQGTWHRRAAASQSAAVRRPAQRCGVSMQRFAAAVVRTRSAVVSQFVVPPPPRSVVPALQAVQRRRETPNPRAVASLLHFLVRWVVPSVLPNPPLHLPGYSGLRPPPPAGELQR